MYLFDFKITFVFSTAKRCRTLSERRDTNMKKHRMLPPCYQCTKGCSDKITATQRASFWSDFWTLDYNRQRDWIVQNVDRKQKRTATNLIKRSRRSNTIVWRLGDVVVCKMFFLHTIGYSSDKLVMTALNNMQQNGDIVVGTCGDKRGHHDPHNKYSAEYK